MLSEKEVDEVKSQKSQKQKPSGFVSALRWVFWILLATGIVLNRKQL